jgi:beta-mannosidase
MKQLFHVTIPKAIAQVDTTRYYHPSSPNTGFKNIGDNMGDSHYYGVWSAGQPFDAYNTHVSRFMSEYGFQSFPDQDSFEKFTLPEDRRLNSPVLQSHQRAKTMIPMAILAMPTFRLI